MDFIQRWQEQQPQNIAFWRREEKRYSNWGKLCVLWTSDQDRLAALEVYRWIFRRRKICWAYLQMADPSFLTLFQADFHLIWAVSGESQPVISYYINIGQVCYEDWQESVTGPGLKGHMSLVSLPWLDVGLWYTIQSAGPSSSTPPNSQNSNSATVLPIFNLKKCT